MPSSLNRRRIETAIAALVAIAAGIVGIATREASRSLGPKFIKVDRLARLKEPVYLTQPPGPGSQLYVVQRQGTVRVLAPDRLLPRPFLKISDLVKQSGGGADGGMTSIAFPPDYARSGQFYVAYTDRGDRLVVARYSRSAANPLVADRASGQSVLTVPESRPERHGGFITFGPDGYLYIGTGDGSPPGDPREVAQDPAQLRGKILRINPAIPGSAEIWASGLGDPRRISFDRASHSMAIADVGDQRYEEIEYLPIDKARGANFGWPAYDGFVVLRGGLPRKQADLPGDRVPAPARLRGDRRLPGPGPAAHSNPRPRAEWQLSLRSSLLGEALRLPAPTGAPGGQAAQLPVQVPQPDLARCGQQRPGLRAHPQGTAPARQADAGVRLPARSGPAGALALARRRRRRLRDCPPARTAARPQPPASGSG